MNCVFLKNEAGEACQNGCGYVLLKDYPNGIHKTCGEHNQLAGDAIKSMFSEVGIAQSRYEKLLRGLQKLGIIEHATCGCMERQEILNRIHLHAKEHGWLSAVKNARRIAKEYHEQLGTDDRS